MIDLNDFQGMIPYPAIFPETEEGVMCLTLKRKVGKARAGTYDFVEAYCVAEECDCRRATIFVLNAAGYEQI